MSARKLTKPKKPYTNANPSASSSFVRSSPRPEYEESDPVDLHAILSEAIDKVLDEGVGILFFLKSACRETKRILEDISTMDGNKEEWNELVRRVRENMSVIEKQVAFFESYPPEDTVIDTESSGPLFYYVQCLENVHETIVGLKEQPARTKSGFLKAFRKPRVDIRKLYREIEGRYRQLMEALDFFAIVVRAKADEHKANAFLILQLPRVSFVAASIHTTCLQGTRTDVLGMMWNWAHNDTPGRPIFWLCDVAGSGKSTVAMSAAGIWHDQGLLGGAFFFSLTSNEVSNTDKFCSAMARDLVRTTRRVIPYIAEAVKQNPSIMQSSFGQQFQTLIVGPLNRHQETVILVIDALDECQSSSQRRELLEALSTAVRGTKNLKIFITSRPDPAIEAVLGPLAIKANLEDRVQGLNHPNPLNDVAIYVHRSLGGILPPEKRWRLIEKANGSFVWASTACRMLRSEANLRNPEKIYDRIMALVQNGGIYELYALIFEHTDRNFYVIMCQMLALLAVAFEPLTMDDFEDLLKHARVGGSGKDLVQSLESVLSMDPSTNKIHFRHPTVVEYLRYCSAPPAVDSRNRLYIDIANAHGQLAWWCLKGLTSPTVGLKFNLCQVESSFYLNRQLPDLEERISKYIPTRLQYASSYWSFHVAETGEDWRRTFKSEVQWIVQSPQVLHWMEVLSFTGGVLRAISGLKATTRHVGFDEETRSAILETRQFLMAFSVPIQDSAPHIYISALPFTPTKSILHSELTKRYLNTLTVTQGLEERYPVLPRTLQGHKGEVYAIAFSPDGSRMISGSNDNTIRQWDADTGQPLGAPLRGHEKAVNSVAFSPDGSRIISGSCDMTIRLWDTESGQPIGKPYKGHEASVTAIAFSLGTSCIAYGFEDNTIGLWNPNTGQLLREPIKGHTKLVTALAFSLDGSKIVSASNDGTIRLWDAITGRSLSVILETRQFGICTLAFSPDGSRIVSGSRDCRIHLWDAHVGSLLGELREGHTYGVKAVIFSPNGSQIASASDDCTIRRWDAITCQPIGEPLRSHESEVITIAFSPDGSRIASGSRDSMIRLWSTDTGQPLGELRGHEYGVEAVAVSPDGSRIASGSRDKTIRLWDTATGRSLGEPLQGHEHSVSTLAFSPDGSRLVSGSYDKTIRLWDVDRRQPLGEPLLGHEYSITAVAFSPDGSQIVSGSYDETIRLWDANTGRPLREPFRGHGASVNTLALSPDGSRIASGSTDQTIRLWDIGTGQQVGNPLRGHEGSVDTLAFSPDGLRIASGSKDKTIRLWDAITGRPLGEPLRDKETLFYTLAFSPDGSRIVSGSYDHTIQLWDANTGRLLGEPFRGHKCLVTTVAFLPDNSRIISGSIDKTIRLWETEIDANKKGVSQNDRRFQDSQLGSAVPDPITVTVPGFKECSLSHDGWVRSSSKLLFWVPPENRHGLQYSHLLTLPTSSLLRATKLDFARFQCGLSWASAREDASH
ncbi:related to WD40-repeat protein (notchless protein) [Serendipita indica DSM 11827]|uniref:Related to WD40-repeat protein (Notchless protein) n=1 Tax=Serendipita indica (strain DSM 11827) TaxID=1109443 RepID=G4TUJ4_SERID|nr:related to WD40-repeat protein (notchless protein) [Serendipita indica DSM 11827]